MGTGVPSNKFKDRPELPFCHRLIYRTRIDVPAELGGRSFVFPLPGSEPDGDVFVNGQSCGFTKAPFAPLGMRCDGGDQAGAGQRGLRRDQGFLLRRKLGRPPGDPSSNFTIPVDNMGQSWVQGGFDFPIGSGVFEIATSSGILLAPSLVVAGPVYTSDVFAIPSVKQKTLGLEITVRTRRRGRIRTGERVGAPHPGPSPGHLGVPAQRVGGSGRGEIGPAEKVFAPQSLTVAAGKEEVVKLAEPWANPKLWWPDDPQMYRW